MLTMDVDDFNEFKLNQTITGIQRSIILKETFKKMWPNSS